MDSTMNFTVKQSGIIPGTQTGVPQNSSPGVLSEIPLGISEESFPDF